jgi:hypothetical protein
MAVDIFNSPEPNVGEITLIGTAGGYGESIVIHLGANNWAVVDSCQDPNSGDCLPLTYLKSLGVDLNHVRVIICTHWHNDHIKGLSFLLEQCENAKLCFAPCTDVDKFRLLLEMDQQKVKSNRSTAEFYKCLEITKKRGNEVIKAISDRLILNLPDSNSQIYTLSPSDATLTAYDHEISTLIEEIRPYNRVVVKNPNSKSVVILLLIGKHRAILGADLEVSSNDKEGWVNIIDNSAIIDKDKPASFFKVPHHGSETGYEKRIWDELLIENSTAKLTPFISSKLPRQKMLDIYVNHTKNLYSSSNIIQSGKPKKRDKSLEKAIKEYRPSLTEVKFSQGIIQSRILLDEEQAQWDTEVYGTAYHITVSSN